MVEQNKKNKSKDNVHYLDFASKHRGEDKTNSFDELAKKLETRLQKIESDLADGLGLIEEDVQKLVSKNKNQYTQEELKADVSDLAKILEERIKNTCDDILATQKNKANKEEVKYIQSLTGQLSEYLSADFLRGLFKRIENHVDEQEVDEFGMDYKILEKLKPIADFMYYKYWRVHTTGVENIPDEGKALIVGNHSGTLPYDGVMLASAVMNEHPVRKDARFLVENFVYHMPFLGSLMYRIGGVRACPENAERLLDKDHLVVVFPEGVKGIGKYFKDRYKLQRFGRGGFIKLCIKTKSPLIPVGIVGAEEIHPIVLKSNSLAKLIGVPYIPITPTFPLFGLLGIIPYPTKWSIHFGKPISFKKYNLKTLDDEIMIHKLSEKVRNHIQDIIFDLLKKRRNIWLG